MLLMIRSHDSDELSEDTQNMSLNGTIVPAYSSDPHQFGNYLAWIGSGYSIRRTRSSARIVVHSSGGSRQGPLMHPENARVSTYGNFAVTSDCWSCGDRYPGTLTVPLKRSDEYTNFLLYKCPPCDVTWKERYSVTSDDKVSLLSWTA